MADQYPHGYPEALQHGLVGGNPSCSVGKVQQAVTKMDLQEAKTHLLQRKGGCGKTEPHGGGHRDWGVRSQKAEVGAQCQAKSWGQTYCSSQWS